MAKINPFLQSPFQALIDKQAEPIQLPGSDLVTDVEVPDLSAAPEQPAAQIAQPAAPAPKKAKAKPASLIPPADLMPVFSASASHFGVPENVLMAIAQQESSYDPEAVNSESGAEGIAQYMGATAKSLGINARDPNEAIPATAMQIAERLAKGMSLEDAVKEHFAGPDRKKWGDKTHAYGKSVLEKAEAIGRELYKDLPSEAPAEAAPAVTADSTPLPNFGVAPEALKRIQAQWNAATPEERKQMEAIRGPRGYIARELNKHHPAKQPAPNPLGLDIDPMTQVNEAYKNPTLDSIDPRAEARARNLVNQGMEGDTANKVARAAALAGMTPGTEPGIGQRIENSDFDFATRKKYQEDPFFSNPAVRGAVKGYEGYKRGILGLNQMAAEVLGADNLAGSLAEAGAESREAEGAMGEANSYGQRMFEGAVSSIAQQVPALIGGAVTGSEGLVLGTMFAQTFGSEYSEGRARGQNEEQAMGRAALYGTFEVVGEKLGLGDTLRGLRGAVDGATTKDVATNMARALLKEIPGEQLTTLGQFGTDKIGSGYGLNTEAGLAEYLQQAADTAVQTVIQGGIMGGVTTGAAEVGNRLMPQRQAPQQMPQERVEPSLQPEAQSMQPAAPSMQPEQDEESWSGEVMGDDGLMRRVSNEGVSDPVAPSGPLEASVASVAAEAPEAGPLSSAVAQAAQLHDADPAPLPAMPEPEPQAPDYTAMPVEELKAQVQQLAAQDKQATDPEQRKKIRAERKTVEKEIGARAKQAQLDSKPAEEPMSMGPFDDIKTANKMMMRYAEKTSVPHEVVEKDGKFRIQPLEASDGLDTAGASGRDDGRGRSGEPADGMGLSDGAGRAGTGTVPVSGNDGTAGERGSDATSNRTAADEAANPDSAVARNPYAAYSASKPEFAESYMDKRGVDRSKYEVQQTGPVRWQIVPRAAQDIQTTTQTEEVADVSERQEVPEEAQAPSGAQSPVEASAGDRAESVNAAAGTSAAQAAPVAERSAEATMRANFEALPSVTIGSWHPVAVEHNGVKRQFLANQKSVNAKGRTASPIYFLTIKAGKMLPDMPPQYIATQYKLDGKNKLTEVGVPGAATEAQMSKWRSAGFELPELGNDPKPKRKVNESVARRQAANAKQEEAVAKAAASLAARSAKKAAETAEPQQAAVEQPPAPIPKATPKKTGGDRARERLKAENPFLSFLATHGISTEDRADTAAERGRAGNRMIPGIGPVYRKSGKRLDELAMLARDEGFLTDLDIDDSGDTGGTRKLSDMIARAVHGKEVIRQTSAEQAMPSADVQLMAEAYALGIETDGMNADQVYDAVVNAHASRYTFAQADITELALQDADIPLDGGASSDNLTDEELDAIFGIRTTASPQGTGRQAQEGATQAAPGRDEGTGEESESEPLLSSYSASDVVARQDAAKSTAREEFAATARADRESKNEREAREVRARADSSIDDFQLGQSAEDQLSGQKGMFGEEAESVRYSVSGDSPMQRELYKDRDTILTGDARLDADMDEAEAGLTDEEYEARSNDWQASVQVPLSQADAAKVIDKVNGMPWFHGSAVTDLDALELRSDGGLFMASDDLAARHYAGKGGRVYERRINVKNPFFVRTSDLTADMESSGEIAKLAKQGFDAIIPLDYGDIVILKDGVVVEDGASYSTDDTDYSLLDLPMMADSLPVLDSFVLALANAGIIKLHANASTLPVKGQAPQGVQALTTADGKIHVVANALNNNAKGIVLHEAFHAGVKSLVGTKVWNDLMARLNALHKQGQSTSGAANAFWAKAKRRVLMAQLKGAVAPGMEAEEFGAYAIEEYANAPLTVKKWVDDLIGAIKAWVLRRFGAQLGKVTPAQLMALAKVALLDVRASRMEPAFSTDSGPTPYDKGLEQRRAEAQRMRAEESSLADYDELSQKEWLRGARPPKDGKLKLYRAVRKGETVLPGDYVTNSRAYAQQHLEDNMGGEGEIISFDGFMDEIFPADGPGEFFYAPRSLGPGQNDNNSDVRFSIDDRRAQDRGTQERRMQDRRTVEVDGMRRPIRTSTGNLVAPDFMAQVAFWKDYDGPVDDEGRPVLGGDAPRYSVSGSLPAGAAAPAQADTEQNRSLTPKEQGLLRRVQAQIQDSFNRVKQVQERITELTGVTDFAGADVYRAETNRPGRIAARKEDARDKLIEPMMKRLAKAGYTPAQLSELLHAQHAEERNAAVASINPEFPDGGSGLTNAQAQEILDRYENEGDLLRLADEARNIARSTLDLKLAYGLITQTQYDTLAISYDSYVPLKGDGEYGPKVKRAMGHEEREEHILENIARDYEQAIVVGEKNLARQSLLQLVLQHPDDALWTARVPPKGRYVAGTVFNISRKGSTDIEASFTSQSQVAAWLEAKGAGASQYEVNTSGGEQVVEFTKPLQDNEVMVYVKGDPVRIQLHDEKLARQLRPLKSEQMNAVLELMRKHNRYLSMIFTGYNPAFIIKNASRDAITGTINMTGNHGAATAAKAWTKYPAAWAAMLKWAATKKVPDTEMGRMLTEYRAQGGKVGASYMSDLEEQGKSLQRMYDDAKGVKGYAAEGRVGKAAWIAARKAVGGAAHAVEIINQAFENALRLALFAQLRAEGKKPGVAAAAAKSVTVNFDRKGAMTAQMGAFYLFINPAIQGTANATITLTKGEHKYQAWALTGMMAAAGFGMAAMGMDEDKDRWLGEKWDTRTKNLRFRVGSTTINIPMSQEFAPFYAIGVAMGEVSRGESSMKAAANVMTSFLDAYYPMQGAVQPDSDNPSLDLLLAHIPTVGKVPAQIATNRNSFGSKVVPETENTKNRPDNLKMSRSTKGSVYDKAAQALASGKPYENNLSKVSPETLKLLWSTYTGGLGRFVADTVGAGNLARQSGVDMEASDVPILKDFVKPDNVNPIRSRFYDLSDEARKTVDEFNAAKKALDGEAMREIAGDPVKKAHIGLAKMVKSINEVQALYAEQAVAINADKKLNDADKRARLKKLEDEQEAIYRKAIEAFKQ